MKHFLTLCVAVLCLSFAGCTPPATINVGEPERPDRIPPGFWTVGFEVEAVPAFVLPLVPVEEASAEE